MFLAQQWESEFHVVEQKGIAAQRKTCGLCCYSAGRDRRTDVARTRLIVRESAVRRAAAAEKALG